MRWMKLIDAGAKVFYCCVCEGDNQHLTAFDGPGACQSLNQLGGQQAQRKSFAASGHCAYAKPPRLVPEYLLLRRAELQFGGHGLVVSWLDRRTVRDGES